MIGILQSTVRKTIRWIYSPVVLIALLMIMGGCSGAGNYGRLQRSPDADRIFKTYQALPDYQYYFTGPAGRPDAIMALQNEYSLETTQWTHFSPFDDTLKKGVDAINFHHSTSVRYYPYGFFILDPEGKRMGIWYSIWDWTTIIFQEDKRIEVFPPAKKDPFGNGERPERMKFD